MEKRNYNRMVISTSIISVQYDNIMIGVYRALGSGIGFRKVFPWKLTLGTEIKGQDLDRLRRWPQGGTGAGKWQ